LYHESHADINTQQGEDRANVASNGLVNLTQRKEIRVGHRIHVPEPQG